MKIFFDGMSDTLANGGRGEVRGLCSFYVKKYRAYTGRNPKTGASVEVRPGRELQRIVDR